MEDVKQSNRFPASARRGSGELMHEQGVSELRRHGVPDELLILATFANPESEEIGKELQPRRLVRSQRSALLRMHEPPLAGASEASRHRRCAVFPPQPTVDSVVGVITIRMALGALVV